MPEAQLNILTEHPVEKSSLLMDGKEGKREREGVGGGRGRVSVPKAMPSDLSPPARHHFLKFLNLPRQHASQGVNLRHTNLSVETFQILALAVVNLDKDTEVFK